MNLQGWPKVAPSSDCVPTTEANLADGPPPVEQLFRSGISFAIGSDSHVSTDPRTEFQLLEYVRRLEERRRVILCTESQSVARTLSDQAWQSGARALRIPTGSLMAGHRADWIVVDPEHPAIAGAEKDELLNRWAFCNAGNPISDVMVNGRWVVQHGHHADEEQASREFVAVVRRILV